MDNDHQELEVVASPKEHKLITTNPDEILRNSKKQAEEKPEVNIKIDLNKGIYYGKDLTLDQKNYLNNHGYKAGFFVKIGKKGPEEYWIKESLPESTGHTFLVQNIKEELEKFTKKTEINIAGKPDIVFRNKKGEVVAIEIETGLSFSKHKNKITDKFDKVKAKYKQNSAIVLTDATKKYLYKEISKTIPVLVRTEIIEFIQSHFKNR